MGRRTPPTTSSPNLSPAIALRPDIVWFLLILSAISLLLWGVTTARPSTSKRDEVESAVESTCGGSSTGGSQDHGDTTPSRRPASSKDLFEDSRGGGSSFQVQVTTYSRFENRTAIQIEALQGQLVRTSRSQKAPEYFL